MTQPNDPDIEQNEISVQLVEPTYDRAIYSSIIELAATHGVGKHFALECIRNKQIPVVAKVKTGKKGAPSKLYDTQAAAVAIANSLEERELHVVRRKSLAFLLDELKNI